jgi:hypothetical protein
MAILKTQDGTRIEFEEGPNHFLFYGVSNMDLSKTYIENIREIKKEMQLY